MSKLFRSIESYESIHEAQMFGELKARGVLPADATTSAVDEGHYIAFYTNDEAFVEKVNRRRALRKTVQIKDILASPTFADCRDQDAARREIEAEGWATGVWKINLTPQRQVGFSGYEEVV